MQRKEIRRQREEEKRQFFSLVYPLVSSRLFDEHSYGLSSSKGVSSDRRRKKVPVLSPSFYHQHTVHYNVSRGLKCHHTSLQFALTRLHSLTVSLQKLRRFLTGNGLLRARNSLLFPFFFTSDHYDEKRYRKQRCLLLAVLLSLLTAPSLHSLYSLYTALLSLEKHDENKSLITLSVSLRRYNHMSSGCI